MAVFTFQAESAGLLSPTEIDATASGSFGAITVRGQTAFVGWYRREIMLASPNACIFSADDPSIEDPPDSDPPFPPVWPYPTGLIYSREFFDMTLRMKRGDKGKFDFQVLSSGAAVNISTYNFRFTAKWSLEDVDNDAVFSLTNSDGITLTAPTNGELRVTINPVKTTGLPSHDVDLYFDLQYTDPADTTEVHTVASGTLKIEVDASITSP